jgi:alpha-1,2-mannosyltransferase
MRSTSNSEHLEAREQVRAVRGLRSLGRHGGWLVFAGSVAIYVALSEQAPWHVGFRRLGYFDLMVYRGATVRLFHGLGLYIAPIVHHFHFTYPPFAALVLAPLAAFPLPVDEVAVTLLNLGALAALLAATLRIWRRRSPDRPLPLPLRHLSTSSLVAIAAALALWLEPVSTTVGYGQVDLLVALLIVCDIARPDTARTKGAAIGLAAGMKLTPLIYVPYLLLTGRRRAAATATGVFAGTIALAFALLPADAARYWGGTFLDSSRVGGVSDAANQSLQGAISRLTDGAGGGSTWVAATVLIALAGLAVAVLAGRRGDEAAGFSLCAIAGLLASPISWTHHWVIAVPALLLLLLRGLEARSAPLLLAATAIAVIGASYSIETVAHPALVPDQPGPLLSSDPYVLIGVLAIVIACASTIRRQRRADPSHRRGQHERYDPLGAGAT